LGVYVTQQGDYRLVLYPLDYDGNICGADFNGTDMTDYPYIYYVNNFGGGVCVESCPHLEGETADNVSDVFTLITYNGVFQPTQNQAQFGVLDGQPQVNPSFVRVANYSALRSNATIACTDDTCYPNGDPADSFTSRGVRRGFGYAYYLGDSYEVVSYCFLTLAAQDRISAQINSTDAVLQVADTAYDFWTKLYADVYTARKYVLGFGFGLSLVVCSVYIFLMRLPCVLNALVWSSIFITIGLFLVGGYYCWSLAMDWSDDSNFINTSNGTLTALKVFSVLLYVLGALFAVMICCLRTQIQLAIGCVKEAGRAVNNMLLIFVIPLIQSVGLLLFMLVWTYYSVYLASLGTIKVMEVPIDVDGGAVITYRIYEFDPFVERCGWFLLFCLFWTANFIIAVGDMMIALSVAKWYFTRNKALIGSWTVLTSFCQICMYHLGTCAYGALILAIVQLIRAMIAKAQQRAKQTNNKIAGCLLCCCQCCFACLEACLKYLHKNAYIQTAIFSTPFCKSCRQAFFLILRNAARLAAVSYVSAAVLLVGKLFICAVTTVIAYYYLAEDMSDQLHSIGGPICIIFLMAYWLSDMFMDVWVSFGNDNKTRWHLFSSIG
jgi:hypothetical protein